jgi:hypothetical protein
MRRFVLLFALAALVSGCVQKQVEQDMGIASEAAVVGTGVDLNAAAVAVSTYLAENGSLGGFNAGAAGGLEPAIKWADGGSAQSGVVSIRGASGTEVVLVTLDATGEPQCLAFVGGARSTGSADAQTPADC